MQQNDLIIQEDPLSDHEIRLLDTIAGLGVFVSYTGFVYSLIITFTTLYSIFGIADNTVLWQYYQTLSGFIHILVVIISGLLYWLMSWLLYRFSKTLKYATQTGKQHYFENAWIFFNRLFIILDVLLVWLILANLLSM